MFLPNKIIKNKKLNYPQNFVGLVLNNPWFYCTLFRRALQMVLRPCARPPKQLMVLGGPCTWFQTMYGEDVVMFLPNKIIKNKKLNFPKKKCCPCTWF